jgi:hypothetical protein
MFALKGKLLLLILEFSFIFVMYLQAGKLENFQMSLKV